MRVLELRKWFKALADEKQLAKVTIQKIKAIMQRCTVMGARMNCCPPALTHSKT